MGSEIERKFYSHPERRVGKRLDSRRIEQGYLADSGSTEIRLRRPDGRLTLKSGHGAQRFEWEVSLPPDDFDPLWLRTGPRVAKVRERFSWKGFTIEVDTFEGPHAGLVTAEVEFSSLAQAQAFRTPVTFGPELTWDPRFKNRALAGAEVPLTPSKGIWSYGVLPFLTGPKGLELVAITTRRHDRWIVPKGQPEPGRTAEQVAIVEAQEEAGLSGRIAGHPLVLPYVRENGTTNLLLFPLQVSRMADKWLESGQRERRVVPLSEAGAFGEVIRLGAQAIQELKGTVGSS